MQKVLLVGVAGASALQLGASPMTSSRAAVRMPAVHMQAEETIDAPVAADASMDMDATKVAPGERFKAISLNALDEWAERFPRLKPELRDIRLSSLISHSRRLRYLVELIDWDREDDIKNDPFYRLVFPTMKMLSPERKLLEETEALKDPFKLKDVVDEFARTSTRTHDQKELNANKKGMEDLTGVQHKYSETVLFFPPLRRRATPTAPTASAGRSSSATPTCALRRRTRARSLTTSRSTRRCPTSSSRAATRCS